MTEVEQIAKSLTKACLMCFSTGKTKRYRGPVCEGPCIACDGKGYHLPRAAHLSESQS